MAAAKSEEQKAREAYLKGLSKAGKKNLALLDGAKIELQGDETEVQLEDLVAEHNLAEVEEGAAEVIDGVDNEKPRQFEALTPEQVAGKMKPAGLYFVAPVTEGPHKGEHVLYNELGKRVSAPSSAARVYGRGAEDPRGNDIKTKEVGEISEFAHIAKAAGANNALRRARRLPNDPQ